MTGIVFDIKEFAVYDGPGIRTTVFMKGCPLRCRWCHNPEGLSPQPQLMVSRAACTHCGACEKVCQHPDACTACGECIPFCRQGYRKIIGKAWTPEALANHLLKGADFFEDGGGVTFSGGEPLLQWPFVRETIRCMPGIHTAVETSGFCSDEVFREVMACCSLVMMDWKVSDPALHLHYTGVPQESIRRHAEMLAEGSTPFILRMPVIPGVNDNEAHFQTVADLVQSAKALVRVDVLPYQKAAGAKYEMVGQHYEPGFDDRAAPEMHTEVFDRMGIPYLQFR